MYGGPQTSRRKVPASKEKGRSVHIWCKRGAPLVGAGASLWIHRWQDPCGNCGACMWHVSKAASLHTGRRPGALAICPRGQAAVAWRQLMAPERRARRGGGATPVKLGSRNPAEHGNPFTYLHPKLLIFQTGLKRRD